MSMKMQDINDIVACVSDKRMTASEVTQDYIARINDHNEVLNVFVNFSEESALQSAERVDKKIQNGETLGRLAGVPIALKDLLVHKDHETTCGSEILKGWKPPYNATVVRKLLHEDAVIIGRTNMDQFGMGSTTEYSAYGSTRNPWNTELTPGGSSGGSAVAVASSLAVGALGSDTGGSIRQPAAFTGIVGVKPTYGSVSRYGLVAFSSSLDQIGPFAKTVSQAALLHSVIAGHDPLDSASLTKDVPDYVAYALAKDIKDVTIGVINQLKVDGVAEDIAKSFEDAVSRLTDLGANIVFVDLPNVAYAVSAYYIIAPSEASSNLARFDGMRYGPRVGDDGTVSAEEVMIATRSKGFSAEVKRRIMIGTFALSSGYYDEFYGKAQDVRKLIVHDFAQAFKKADVLVSPTTPNLPFSIGMKTQSPLEVYAQDITTVPVNLAGLPAMSVPMGLTSSGLPMGMQIIAPATKDERLYQVGSAFERSMAADVGIFPMEYPKKEMQKK